MNKFKVEIGLKSGKTLENLITTGFDSRDLVKKLHTFLNEKNRGALSTETSVVSGEEIEYVLVLEKL